MKMVIVVVDYFNRFKNIFGFTLCQIFDSSTELQGIVYRRKFQYKWN